MMEVKKFRAATTRAALEQIKLELGEDAFVLETKKVKTRKMFGFKSIAEIEITATASNFGSEKSKTNSKATGKLNLKDESPASPFTGKSDVGSNSKSVNPLNLGFGSSLDFKEKLANSSAKTGKSREIETVEISTEAPRVIHPKKEKPIVATQNIVEPTMKEAAKPIVKDSSREFEALRAEIREVKFTLGSMAAKKRLKSCENETDAGLASQVFKAPFDRAIEELKEIGVSLKLARKVISNAIANGVNPRQDSDQIAQTALEEFIKTAIRFDKEFPMNKNISTMAFVGPTGVGKTTTIAKIAARISAHQNRRVELVTLDTYRIAAVDQLRTYAEIIGAGFHSVRNVFELDSLLNGFSKDAIVLIDTMGKSPHDLADQYDLSEYLRWSEEISTCLTLQATTHPHDAVEILNKFGMFGINSMVLTKLDETQFPGRLLELIAESALPMAYLCNGQRVPEDMFLATPKSLISRIYGDKQISFK